MKRKLLIAAALTVVLMAAPANVQAAESTKAESEAKKSQPAEAKKAPEQVKVTVVEGDSLSIIADKHATTWVRLFNANEFIANPDVINPGDEVRIPSADEQLPERALPAPVAAAPAAPVSYQSAQPNTTYRASTPAPATNYPVDGNSAKAYIYSRESGNNPNATNPNGCYGIGQDCNGVVRNQCGANYTCQDQYFTNYAMRRYGSWEAAYAFWQNNHWW